LEAVRAEMAQALRDDPSLRPEDLAVIPADSASVLPLLRALFTDDDGAPGNVPVLLPDGGGGGADEGPLLAGFRALLDLAANDLTRGELIGLLRNPAVLRAAALTDAILPTVERALEDAGFARGWGDAGGGRDGDSTLAAA